MKFKTGGNFMKPFLHSFIISLLLITPRFSFATILMHVYSVSKTSSLVRLKGYIDSWDEDDNTPNPCYNSTEDCFYSFQALTPGRSQMASRDMQFPARSYKTIGEAGKAFKKKYSLPYRLEANYVSSDSDSDNYLLSCITMGYYAIYGRTGDRLPGVVCKTSPPEDLICTFTGNTNLEHGILSANEIDNNEAESNLWLTCNKNTKMNLYAFGEAGNKYITLKTGGSLKSQLLISNQEADNGIMVDVKANTPYAVPIKSRLIKSGEVEEGPFHGSGVITVSMY